MTLKELEQKFSRLDFLTSLTESKISKLQTQFSLLYSVLEVKFPDLRRVVQHKTKTVKKGIFDFKAKSKRKMTKDDAQRVLFGDLKDCSMREVAQILGLSYNQIFSVRRGFTFKRLRR